MYLISIHVKSLTAIAIAIIAYDIVANARYILYGVALLRNNREVNI